MWEKYLCTRPRSKKKHSNRLHNVARDKYVNNCLAIHTRVVWVTCSWAPDKADFFADQIQLNFYFYFRTLLQLLYWDAKKVETKVKI